MSKKLTRQFDCSKMMLPEHRAGLRRHIDQIEWDEKHRRPRLDEQRREELQGILETALLKQQPVKVTVLNENGFEVYHGVPRRLDPAFGLIYLDTGHSRLLPVRASEVVQLDSSY